MGSGPQEFIHSVGGNVITGELFLLSALVSGGVGTFMFDTSQ